MDQEQVRLAGESEVFMDAMVVTVKEAVDRMIVMDVPGTVDVILAELLLLTGVKVLYGHLLQRSHGGGGLHSGLSHPLGQHSHGGGGTGNGIGLTRVSVRTSSSVLVTKEVTSCT